MKHSRNLNYDKSNLLLVIKEKERQQDSTRGPTCWMAYEEELVELRERLAWFDRVETSFKIT
jgi:hypothetical protein